MISQKEKIIIEGIKNKSTNSLEDLISLYGNLVDYIAKSILKEDQLKEYAEEAYNDVFTTVWFNIDCFDEEYGNFKGWIISITKFKALDIKKKIFKESFNIELIDEITKSEDLGFSKIENREIANEILDKLEKKDKIIFIKRYLEGYSIKEIAKEMGYSENYIHTRISRSRKKIKESSWEGIL